MTTNTTVTPIRHKDVYGKELLYIKIETENGTTVINVGEKTLIKVEELITEKKEKAALSSAATRSK